jgi:hypothetical protein
MTYRTRIFTEPTPEPVPDDDSARPEEPAGGAAPFAAAVLRDAPGLGQAARLDEGVIHGAVLIMRPVSGSGYRGPDDE